MCRKFLFAVAALVCAQEPAILRPENQTILRPGPLTVVARGPASARLVLDGQPIVSAQPAPGVHTAAIEPAAGMHELMLGTAKVRFAVGMAPGAEGWKTFRPHPPVAQCTACHAVKDGLWAFQSDRLADSCAGCHDLKAFPKLHMHNTEVLNECQLCHQPHGSTEKSHLKMNKETACKICHG
jgi:predicted CXXCH cytochrome family protein